MRLSVTAVALFHSVLGVRAGVLCAADLLRSHGHDVTVVDQYNGIVFDDYVEADAYATGIGYPSLMKSAVEAITNVERPFVVAGFSNGGGMAEYVAAITPGVRGALLLSGALDPTMLGIQAWSETVPVQIHYTAGDPFRDQMSIDAVEALVRRSGAPIELFNYPGTGHLFTDQSLPAEYQPLDASLLWDRAIRFLDRINPGTPRSQTVRNQEDTPGS